MNAESRNRCVVVVLVAAGAIGLGWWGSGAHPDAGLPGGSSRESGTADGSSPVVHHRARLGRERAPRSAPRSGCRQEARLRIRVVRQGAPAPGIWLTVDVARAGDGGVSWYREFRTDARGEAVIDSLPVGIGRVQCYHGGARRVRLRARKSHTVTLRLGATVVVAGRVLTDAGLPAKQASIWMSSSANGRRGRVVATAGPDGAFEVAVPTGRRRYIRAVAPDDLGSLMVVVPNPRARRDLVLRLQGRAAGLDFRVQAADGRAVAGAEVCIGSRTIQTVLAGGAVRHSVPGPVARTGPDGRVRFDGLRGGLHPVHVRKDGHARHAGTVFLAPGERLQSHAVLGEPTVVHGRARFPDGSPCRRAFVAFGETGAFAGGSVLAGADGTFELRNLPLGDVKLRATVQAHGEDYRSEAVLHVVAGARLVWNPVLRCRARTAGDVRDSAGRRLAGWRVVAFDRGYSHECTSASDGSWKLGCELSSAARLAAFKPAGNGFEVFPRATAAVSRPGVRIVLRVHDAEPEGASFEGDVGPATTDVQLLVESACGWYANSRLLRISERSFRTGVLPPGRYRVTMQSGGRVWSTGPLVLRPGEVRTLGTWSWPATARDTRGPEPGSWKRRG